MRVSVCVGNYAKRPLKIPVLEIPVYCMEELCRLLRENTFLLDTSMMNRGLVDWIDEECGLPDLAGELHMLLERGGSFSAFMTTIMEYVGFYEEESIRRMERVLQKSAGLSVLEKRKQQLDYLVRRKKYTAALKGYDELLALWREESAEYEELLTDKLYTSLLQHRGVVLARQMRYAEAADSFYEAYEIGGRREYFYDFLAAKRMELSPADYVSFAASFTDNSDVVMELERDYEKAGAALLAQSEHSSLKDAAGLRENGETELYNEIMDRFLQNAKASYRSCVEAGDIY